MYSDRRIPYVCDAYREVIEGLDLCQYFEQKKWKDHATFFVLRPPFAKVSYN